MSAFICSTKHFQVLGAYAVSGQWPALSEDQLSTLLFAAKLPSAGRQLSKHERAAVVANVLYAENVRSVAYRYREEPRYVDGLSVDGLPGATEREEFIEIGSGLLGAAEHADPVAILKMCDGLEYQSCETENYRQTPAYEVLNLIRRAAVHRLPGYDDAPWELHEFAQAAPRAAA